MIRNLLIDLDGTLTDPKQGIIRCVQYALEKLDQPIPPGDDLLWFIGPPLRASFEELLAGSGKDADLAVTLYRERFGTVGLLENEVYDDVKDLLAAQADKGRRQFIASTKPHVYIHPILEHFGIHHWFEGIYGSELDGTRAVKVDLLHYIFEKHNFDPAETVMIGDRIHDMTAAKAVGVTSIWVDYGYGSPAERDRAEPDHICATVADLDTLLNTI